MTFRRPLTSPVSIAAARARRQEELVLEGRRDLWREVRAAIAPDGALLVEGVRWVVEVRETEGGLVRADATCGAFRVHTHARWSTVEQVARELGDDLRAHVENVHEQIVAAADAIRFARATADLDDGDLLTHAG